MTAKCYKKHTHIRQIPAKCWINNIRYTAVRLVSESTSGRILNFAIANLHAAKRTPLGNRIMCINHILSTANNIAWVICSRLRKRLKLICYKTVRVARWSLNTDCHTSRCKEMAQGPSAISDFLVYGDVWQLVTRLADLEVEWRRQQDVARCQVSMCESAVGDVFHAESHLATHGDALSNTQWR